MRLVPVALETRLVKELCTVEIDFCAVANFRACMGGAGLRLQI